MNYFSDNRPTAPTGTKMHQDGKFALGYLSVVPTGPGMVRVFKMLPVSNKSFRWFEKTIPISDINLVFHAFELDAEQFLIDFFGWDPALQDRSDPSDRARPRITGKVTTNISPSTAAMMANLEF